MGWLDYLTGKAKEAAGDYCPVPYLIDQEWPLTGRPDLQMWWTGGIEVNADASNGNMVKSDFACGLAGWHYAMWCDFPTGMGEQQAEAGRPILCGMYTKNMNTNEEIWTVFPWEVSNQGQSWQQMLEIYKGKIALADPPANAPGSQFIDDPEMPSVGPPPGTVMIPDPDPTAPPGSKMVAPGSKVSPEYKTAGFPLWVIPAGLAAIGVAWYLTKRKKKKGKKSKRAWGTRRKPAWEI